MDEKQDESLKVSLSDLNEYRKRKGRGKSVSPPARSAWMPFAFVGALAAGFFLGLVSGGESFRS